jgi:hypothetical protein
MPTLIQLLADYWWLAIFAVALVAGEYLQCKEMQEISKMLDGEEHEWP